MELYNELYRQFPGSLGLLANEHPGGKPRGLVTTYRWLPRLRAGSWQVVLPIVHDGRSLTEATYQAVVRLRARRVYTFVPYDLRLGKPTCLRLEAMSGTVIDSVIPYWPARTSEGKGKR